MMLTIRRLPSERDIRDIIFAEAGERQNKSTKEMTNSQFSLANRKQLADMLGSQYEGLRYRTKEKFREKQQALCQSLIKEFAEKKGALKLTGQIEAAEEKIKATKAELLQLGFEFDDDDLTLSGGSVNPLDSIIDARVEKEIGTSDAIDARFDSAQIAMMTVASLEDAEKLLKSVSEI